MPSTRRSARSPGCSACAPDRAASTWGVPLLTGLTEAQFKAVLAHQCGHFTGGDTRLSALVVRGRVQIGRTVRHFHAKADSKKAAERARQQQAAARRTAKGRKAKEIDTAGAGVTYRLMAAIYTAYAQVYMRASLSTARAQEYATDLAATRITGRDATASALREIPVLATAHDFSSGGPADRRPTSGDSALPGPRFCHTHATPEDPAVCLEPAWVRHSAPRRGRMGAPRRVRWWRCLLGTCVTITKTPIHK